MNKKLIKKVMGTTMLCAMLSYYTMPTFAYTNEETIYSKSDVNGKNYKTIVSQLEEDKDGMHVNKVDSNKDLPIEYQVTYKLDGRDISAKDVIGKKGKVTINIKYVNKDEKQVNINGSYQTMYTPFLVVSGVIIDNEINTNIKINHGKVINNGTKSIVAGFAVPGLIESLKLEDSNVDVCDTIEISMDTEKFELGNIMTFATPKVFSSLNIKMSDFNSLFNKVTDLQNASNKLADGTKTLNDGMIKFDKGVDTLKSGVDEYSSKSKEFNKAVSQVSNGANELNKKYTELDSGINTLNNSSKQLESGAKQIANGTKAVSSNLDKISGGLSDASTGSKKLNAGIAKAEAGVKEITTVVKAQIDNANSDETKAKLKQISDLITTNTNTINQLKSVNTSLNTQLSAVTDESTKATLQKQIKSNRDLIKLLTGNNTALQSSLETIKNAGTQLGTLYSGLADLKTGMSDLKGGAKDLDDGLNTLDTGASTLANKTKELVTGAGDLQAGTSQLKTGTKSLAQGSSQVAKGIGTLSNGTTLVSAASNKLTNATDTISSGVKTLSNGSKELVKGSTELKDGMNKFKKEGIDKVVNIINVDGKNLLRRVEKLEELSENYNTFENDDKKREDIQFVSIMDSLESKSDENKDDKKD